MCSTVMAVVAVAVVVDDETWYSGETSRHWLRPPLDRLGFAGGDGGGSEPRVVCRPGLHPSLYGAG